jgi:hypothetical protein
MRQTKQRDKTRKITKKTWLANICPMNKGKESMVFTLGHHPLFFSLSRVSLPSPSHPRPTLYSYLERTRTQSRCQRKLARFVSALHPPTPPHQTYCWPLCKPAVFCLLMFCVICTFLFFVPWVLSSVPVLFSLCLRRLVVSYFCYNIYLYAGHNFYVF